MGKFLPSFALALLASALSLPVDAAEFSIENRLKAALIYKMGLYVTWNDSPSQVNYCFIGEQAEQISSILRRENEQGKLLKNVKIIQKPSIEEVALYECQVLFAPDIDSDDSELYQNISMSTLTITSKHRELKNGIIASIEIKNRKPHLAVSKQNLKRSNIRIDTRLLASVTFKD